MKGLPFGLQEKNESRRLKTFKGSTHYLGDKQKFEVSSEGPSSGFNRSPNFTEQSVLKQRQ